MDIVKKHSASVISRIMNVPLQVTNDSVTGDAKVFITLPTGDALPLIVTATTSFYNEQLGVLFHIRGDLYILVSHWARTTSSSLYILDASKCSSKLEDLISPTYELRTAFSALRKAVKAGYHYKNGAWRTLTLPKT